MQRLLSTLIILLFSINAALAQFETYDDTVIVKKDKSVYRNAKGVKYNAFGGSFPLDQLMIGGNHVLYKKLGYGLSWRIGVQNIMVLPQGLGAVPYDTAVSNGWLTDKKITLISYSVMPIFVIPLTKKIPIYFGAGVARQKQYVEYQPIYLDYPEWQINAKEVKFLFNFTGGIMVPLFGRVILNVGYDHLPQTVFVGVAIRGVYAYEDIVLW